MATEKNDQFKFLSPEDADIIIKKRIESLHRNGGNSQKWSDEERLIRDNVILEYILDSGLSRLRTAEQISDRWGIGMTTAYRYIREAFKTLAKAPAGEIAEKKKVQLERLEYLYAEAREQRDNELALKILAEISKLEGFNTDNKNIAFNGDDKIQITFE